MKKIKMLQGWESRCTLLHLSIRKGVFHFHLQMLLVALRYYTPPASTETKRRKLVPTRESCAQEPCCFLARNQMFKVQPMALD